MKDYIHNLQVLLTDHTEVTAKCLRLEHQLTRTRTIAHERSREAKELKRCLTAIIEKIPTGLMATDEKLNVKLMSNYSKRMMGVPINKERVTDKANQFARTRNVRHHEDNRPLELDETPIYLAVTKGVVTDSMILETVDDNGKNIIFAANAVPIRCGGKITGAITAWRDVTEIMQQKQVLEMTIEKLKTTTEGITNAMIQVMEIRDPYTVGHQRRVTQLATAVGKKLALSDNEINELRFSAMLHDIGKVSISSELLARPGKLTDLEQQMIRLHPKAGYDILHKIDFPWPLAEITLQHHERWDGSGYPLGLAQQDILLSARIIGIADTIEAMSFSRPYRSVLGTEESLNVIESSAGLLYDPEVAKATLAVFHEDNFQFVLN